MREHANMEAVASAGPDYLGFIFYPHSPRYVGDHFKMPHELPTNVKRVGVFVNELAATVVSLVLQHKLDVVQLHGDEPPSYLEHLKARGIKIIKVFRVDADFDFATTTPYERWADYFLFDTKGKQYGGNSMKFNWDLLTRYTGSVPFFLSGGIGPADVTALKNFKHTQWHAIDVNSGVELEPGLKDLQKVKRLIQDFKEINLKEEAL
ncbi:MAG: phosphoribosylanthranilate isomerase [Cyclobacteriaceae bacterium]|nr:phosphoribosylanthranilate isomerase [Cyclobacteriaceae bacterium]